MIDEANYSKATMRRVTEILPYGTINEVSEETEVKVSIVRNVWYGKQYKKNVVDAIVARYKKILQSHVLSNLSQAQ